MAKELNALEQVLVDTINGMKEGMGKAIDFASVQIPDVIHQLLVWKMAESVVYTIVSLAVIWLFFVLRKRILIAAKETYDDEMVLFMYYLFGGVFLVLIPALIAVENILCVLKIWLAPKLYLIEYVANLVK